MEESGCAFCKNFQSGKIDLIFPMSYGVNYPLELDYVKISTHPFFANNKLFEVDEEKIKDLLISFFLYKP